MGDKQRKFREAFPYIHQSVCDYFPDFDYRTPNGDIAVICDMRNPNNKVGHQQRAVTTYWAIEMCSPLDLGLDVGAHKGLTPFCIHVDINGDGRPHPIYGGGPYMADLAWDATKLAGIVPDNSLPYIGSNHSLEHMPAAGDAGIVDLLAGWLKLLRHGGILAMVVPDNDHFPVMSSDPDHKHAWGGLHQTADAHVFRRTPQ